MTVSFEMRFYGFLILVCTFADNLFKARSVDFGKTVWKLETCDLGNMIFGWGTVPSSNSKSLFITWLGCALFNGRLYNSGVLCYDNFGTIVNKLPTRFIVLVNDFSTYVSSSPCTILLAVFCVSISCNRLCSYSSLYLRLASLICSR